MSKNKSTRGAMLDLWRPPKGSGDPVGCIATTYTFDPGLFDEQCLSRFLEIESEPNREDLAFLLERESRLGSVYAGVLVDYSQAGVEHSLRWDVLPVRIRGGKQHAKLSLLAWTGCVRIIVASSNLTEPGYRTNYEVASSVDMFPNEANADMLEDALAFLRGLLLLVPGASENLPEIQRAKEFLDRIEKQVAEWRDSRKQVSVRQKLVFTLPSSDENVAARSSLEVAVQLCRKRGGSPSQALIASPFFDTHDDAGRVAVSLCKLMARGQTRKLSFCVPVIRDEDTSALPRIAAPKSLIIIPRNYQTNVIIKMLPDLDSDKNRRPWHAKMIALISDSYSALMVGSSNFTCAGMGVGQYRNAEANLLTIVGRVEHGREIGYLESIWPEMQQVKDPDSAEWIGAIPELEDDENDKTCPLPAGFISATYRAGDKRCIILRLAPEDLPKGWCINACGQDNKELLSASKWFDAGRLPIVEFAWEPVQPPCKLLVRWDDNEAFLPLNVEDSRGLPPPPRLEQMTADDMLLILAASDPGAAFRAWARQQQPPDFFDYDLDSAVPVDLDPLRRYDLYSTFLHRIRQRARLFAQLRSNLQRPVWGRQALEWRLRGLIGIESLADRLLCEFAKNVVAPGEALLVLSDFLIVLHEVDYQPESGSLEKSEFYKVFRPFLAELADKIREKIRPNCDRISGDLVEFMERIVERCRR